MVVEADRLPRPGTAHHRGYLYQDLVAATRLVDLLIGSAKTITVDERLLPGDRFDDLATEWASGTRERTQMKHSDQNLHPLAVATFTNDGRLCRLDRLVSAAISLRDHLASDELQLRLILRDAPPSDSGFLSLLRSPEPDPGPFARGWSTTRLAFRPEAILSAAAVSDSPQRPIAARLQRIIAGASISRADFDWFCNQFVVEAGAPEASFDLSAPGPAEQFLLERASRDVGAGSFPNAERSDVDVAAALIGAAAAARAGMLAPTVDELLRRTGLVRTFGAVSRLHPIVESEEVERDGVSSLLVTATEKARVARAPMLLVAPPGQGKTWALQRLAESLAVSGWIVAEHYCYLGSADEERDERVDSRAAFGSLLSALGAAEPDLVGGLRPRFAADAPALTEVLQRATGRGLRVALLVDGIDHVSRVLGDVPGRPDPSTAFAAELAALEIPHGAVLVVASQPGTHLARLEASGAIVEGLPRWSSDELRRLAEHHGCIPPASRDHSNASSPVAQPTAERGQTGDWALREEAEIARNVVDALESRSGGNALYATYLCRELVRTLPADPASALDAFPEYDEHLAAYYQHLTETIGAAAPIAETLALVPFAITRAELQQIFPEVGHLIDGTVEALSAAIVERGTYGGISFYHESFARFLLRRLESRPESERARLDQIITWLLSNGFLEDQRSFLFLAPLLARAKRHAEVVALIDDEFTVNAVAAGMTPAAIRKNLAVAASSAVAVGDWPTIVRCFELSRAVATFEREHLDQTSVEFADVAIGLLGVDRFAERLRFDGRPTLPARVGLLLCESVDRAGGVAPWGEYLETFRRAEGADGTAYSAQEQRQVAGAYARGVLRRHASVHGPATAAVASSNAKASPKAGDGERDPHLVTDPVAWTREFAERHQLLGRAVVAIVAEVLGQDQVASLLKLTPPSTLKGLGAAVVDFAHGLDPGNEHRDELIRTGVEATLSAPQAGDVARFSAIGIQLPSVAMEREELIGRTRAVTVQSPGMDDVWRWLDCVEVAAVVDPIGMDAAEALAGGPGWYRTWLRYALELARIGANRALSASARSKGAVEALEALGADTSPFVGQPRAVDLYNLHGVIEWTLRRALRWIDDSHWPSAIHALRILTDGLSVTFKGEFGGPIPPDLLVELVIDHSSPARLQDSEPLVEDVLRRTSGNYYSDMARLELMAARLALRGGGEVRAASHWRKATAFALAHGSHKDITLYELLDSIPSLVEYDRTEARRRLALVQPLCQRVVEHTDGDETGHARAQWWRELTGADPIAAAYGVSRGLLERPNDPQVILEEARTGLWRATVDAADPEVSAALRVTTAATIASSDVILLRRLSSAALPQARQLADWVLARTDERPPPSVTDAEKILARDVALIQVLNEAAAKVGASQAARPEFWRPAAETPGGEFRGTELRAHLEAELLIRYGDDPGSLLTAVREWRRQPYLSSRQRWDTDRFVNLVGYRLVCLHEREGAQAVRDVLLAVADELRFRSDTDEIFSAWASGFERFGAPDIAVDASVLAFTRSRGGGGWLTFGGEAQVGALLRGLDLNRERALEFLGAETQRVIASDTYGRYGVTQALIRAFAHVAANWGEGDQSEGSGDLPDPLTLWDAAFRVIERRLPRTGETDDPFLPYEPDEAFGASDRTLRRPPWSLDQAIGALAVAGIAGPGREQKRRSLIAIATLLEYRPSALKPGLVLALSADLDTPTLTWLLDLVVLAGSPKTAISGSADALVRLSTAPALVVRTLAREILQAIGQPRPPLPLAAPNMALARTPARPMLMPIRPETDMPPTSEAGTPEAMAQSVLAGIDADRLSVAQSLMAGFEAAVVSGLAAAMADPAFTDQMHRRLQLLTSRPRLRWPDAVLPQDEKLETLLQELAGCARGTLAAMGEVAADGDQLERELCASLLDGAGVPVSVEATRVPRPPHPLPCGPKDDRWSLADAVRTGRSVELPRDVVVLARGPEQAASAPMVDQGPYREWRVVGLYETWRPPSDGASAASETVLVHMGGLELWPSGHSIDYHVPPFGQADARSWFNDSRPAGGEKPNKVVPLVCLDAGTRRGGLVALSGLGVPTPLLVLSAPFMGVLGLAPSRKRFGFEMTDSAGPALALRTWRTRYETSEYELPAPSITGVDIVMRPDLFERLGDALGPAVVWRELQTRSVAQPE